MNKLTLSIGVLALTSTSALAGGFDRSGQSITALFEDGNYAEFSLGMVQPDVTGTAYGVEFEDSMAEDYTQLGFAYKGDINESLSFALIYDQPYGANVAYPTDDVSPVVSGTTAEITSSSFTILGQYNLGNGISIYGGPRYQIIEASYDVPTFGITMGAPAPAQGYNLAVDSSGALGFVVGAAYEKPEIALRASLTYSSSIEHDVEITENALALGLVDATSDDTIKTPASLNAEFQTGINERTLVFASARYVQWSDISYTTAAYEGATGGDIYGYDDDTITYGAGVGYKVTDSLSLAGSISYEAATKGDTSLLGPTDGQFGVGLAAVYSVGNAKITAGVRHVSLGDSSNDALGHDFSDNSALAFGVKVGFNF